MNTRECIAKASLRFSTGGVLSIFLLLSELMKRETEPASKVEPRWGSAARKRALRSPQNFLITRLLILLIFMHNVTYVIT